MTHLLFGSGVRRDSAPGWFALRPAGSGAARPGRVLRGRVRRAASVLVVSAALVAAGASGAVASPSPSPTPSSAAGEANLVLAPLAHGVVSAGTALSATIDVSNSGADALEPTALVLELGTAPLGTTADLDAWIDSGDLTGETAVIDRPAVGSIAPGESELIVSTVAPEALAGRPPGVYALSAMYGADVVSRSAVVVQGEAPATASVGVIVAVTAEPQSTGLLSVEQLTALTAPDGRLTALLSAVAGTPAILAIDPAVLASIRVLGDTAPVTALAWLDRLAALPNERFALQFGDADVAIQADAGLTALLEPTTLEYATSAADFSASAPGSTPAPRPSATGTDDEEGSDGDQETTVPDLDTLLTVPGARAAVYWPAQGRADQNALGVLSQQPSASGAPATVLLSSASTTRSTVRAAATGASGSRLLVYEAGASDAVRSTAGAPSGDVEAASALISAQIALESSTPTGPLLVTTQRMTELGADALRTALDTVFGYPGVTPASLSTLLTSEPTAAEVSAPADEEAAARLTALLSGEASIAQFSSIIDDPSLLTAPERTAILQLIGAGWRDEPDAWAEALDAHAEATTKTLTSVSIQEPSTVQLVSPEAVLPFFIRNDLPFTANVVLVSTPDNLRLDVERTLPVQALPGVNTRVEVPVRARVGSGEVTIELRLLSPTFEQVGPVQRAQVTVRAEWERIGIIGLSAIVVLLLGAGFVRTVRRRRRARNDDANRDDANRDDANPDHAETDRADHANEDESVQADPAEGRDE